MEDQLNGHGIIPKEGGVTLTWSNLSVRVDIENNSLWKKKSETKFIINKVAGVLKPGNLVAVLGASGAGKSTLMLALASRLPSNMKLKGDIRVNGQPVGNFMSRSSGFMHQEDLFIDTLTVTEHLMFMAQMKLSFKLKKEELEALVTKVIVNLGLTDCSNRRIGSPDIAEVVLSGGERKRLAFGVECLTDPAILFCDEPTTGLDSYFANRLVLIMRDLAIRKKKTVMCTIHQPSSDLINLFHQVILVAEGRIVYSGPTETVLEFFKGCGYECPASFNRAEFVIKTVSPLANTNCHQTVRQLCKHFSSTEQFALITAALREAHSQVIPARELKLFVTHERRQRQFWVSQMTWLCKRSFTHNYRKGRSEAVQLLLTLIAALVIGLCYRGSLDMTQAGIQSRQGATFSLMAQCLYGTMFTATRIFIIQQHLFMREYRDGLYTPLQFYISQTLIMLPGMVINTVIFTAIFYSLSGFRNSMPIFLLTLLVLVLGASVSGALGSLVSTMFDTVEIAMAYTVPINMILQVTSSQFMSLRTLPAVIDWMKYLSSMMYTDEDITILQWTGVSNISCGASPDLPCLRNGREVLDKYGFRVTHFWPNMISLAVLFIGFHICASFIFAMRARKRK